MNSHKKTIAIFSALYMPHLGGVEKYSQSIARELSGDCDVIVFCCNTEKMPVEVMDGNVKVYYLPCFPISQGRFPIPKPDGLRLIRKVFSETPIDFAIVQCRFYLLSLWADLFLKNKGIRFIQIEHGAGKADMKNPIVNIIWHTFDRAVTVIEKTVSKDFYGVSQAAIRWLEHYGIQGKGVLSNSVAPSDFVLPENAVPWRTKYNIPSEVILIAFCGRVMREKGITDLLNAFDSLDREDICLALAGDGDMECVAPWQGRENIHFLGHIIFSEVPALLHDTQIFCLPSRFIEGQPTAVLEAGCCGTAVIATASGGTLEVIKNQFNGILVPSEDVTALTDALRELIDSPEKRVEMGSRLHETILERFTWSVTAEKVRKIMNNEEP